MSAGLEALSNGCGVFPLDWRAFRLRGADRRKFLNGLVTNDVARMHEGGGMAACLLTPKGMLRAYFLLYEAGDSIRLFCPKACAANLAETMKKMIMLSESTFDDDGDAAGLLFLAGPDAGPVLERTKTASRAYPWTRLSEHGRIVALRTDESASSFVAAGAVAVAPEEFETWRVEKRFPLYGVDMGEATIPLEARLDDAVSFDKGCYMGQETISRVHNLGHLNKILVQLKVSAAETPAPGSAVLDAAGKPVGSLTSAVVSAKAGGILALATVRLDSSKPGTVLGVAAPRGSHRAEVVEL